ncbi:MAG: diaminobutyrate--2-oxoglutarate transaminase, partial [Actinomycetota bacterium]
MTHTRAPAGSLDTISRLESEVRSYCRQWPAVFERARGAVLVDEKGRQYLDFFAGAGALNYGHNHPLLRDRLVRYLTDDGIIHSLDVATRAKSHFLETLDALILAPRFLNYRVQFPGPTGTNAVESALKLARKVTGRSTIVSFTNGFHGMTLGALATTGARSKRAGAGLPLTGVARLPYDGYLGPEVDTLLLLERMLDDPSSGLDHPAAVLVETVQAEGGVNVASSAWLRGLEQLCRRHGILLVLDEIQTGCGRTGSFFSFEEAGLDPDIVCLSKGLTAGMLPLAA